MGSLRHHRQPQPDLPELAMMSMETFRDGKRGAVTVLAVGTWLEQYPQIAQRILGGGHDLGNHTMHHLDIAAMDAAEAFAEIAGCARRLRALTGSAGRWFRPSQTQYSTPLIEREARRAGYRTCVSYDVDSLDYTDPGPDAIVSTVLGKTRPGSIVSLHLGHSGTVTALPAILVWKGAALVRASISAVPFKASRQRWKRRASPTTSTPIATRHRGFASGAARPSRR